MTETELLSAIEAAHASGDGAELARLQAQGRKIGLRSARPVQRDGKPALSVVWDPQLARVREGAVLGTARIATAGSLPARTRTAPSTPARSTTRRPGGTRAPTAALMLDRPWRKLIASPFDGLEAVWALFGRQDGDLIVVEDIVDITLKESASRTAVAGSRGTVDEHRARQADRGRELVGDLHTHPDTIGRTARPSDNDLLSWIRTMREERRGWWLGIVAQRTVDTDDAWLAPALTGILVFDDHDAIAVPIVRETPEHDYTTNGGRPAWRL